MQFEEKKLGVEDLTDLLQCDIRTVEPYALMLAPVYVFMKRNQKLVSVKAPLDFFTPDELEHLSRYESFYIPKFVQSGSRFQTAAKLIRNLINPAPYADKLSPTSYEISNEVILVLGTLWGKSLSIDPFYSAVFADELCGSFAAEKMVNAREIAVTRHDSGILLSGILTFVMLHLGWYDLQQIQSIRFAAYEAIVDHDETWSDPDTEWKIIARDLRIIISENSRLTQAALAKIPSEWSKKLLGRIERIKKTPSLNAYPSLHYSEEQGVSA